MTTSIHLPTISPFSIHTDMANVIMPQSKTAFFLEMRKRCCQDSHTASSMLIKLVIPAKATEIKKNRAKRLPSGICLNTSGRVKNIKLGH